MKQPENSFAPSLVTFLTPISKRWVAVLGSLVITIVLVGSGTSDSERELIKVAPVALTTKFTSLLVGALFPATPGQMYTYQSPRMSHLSSLAFLLFSNVSFIEIR